MRHLTLFTGLKYFPLDGGHHGPKIPFAGSIHEQCHSEKLKIFALSLARRQNAKTQFVCNTF
jgi:hypothetical protein